MGVRYAHRKLGRLSGRKTQRNVWKKEGINGITVQFPPSEKGGGKAARYQTVRCLPPDSREEDQGTWEILENSRTPAT